MFDRAAVTARALPARAGRILATICDISILRPSAEDKETIAVASTVITEDRANSKFLKSPKINNPPPVSHIKSNSLLVLP
ncbi:hypothetical protein BST66_35380 [Bradyrhizobium canariense]|nr:hypothetical protein BST66_35380 [Bradyrhizobium canariense]